MLSFLRFIICFLILPFSITSCFLFLSYFTLIFQARKESTAKVIVTKHPEVVDDFVRNFLVRMGMERTLDCFQTEWYSKFSFLQLYHAILQQWNSVLSPYVSIQQFRLNLFQIITGVCRWIYYYFFFFQLLVHTLTLHSYG